MPRKPVRVTTLPWKRTLAGPPSPSGPHVIRRLMKEGKWNPKLRKFDLYRRNENIDIYTKRSALKASPSVISVECYSGHVPVLQFSGCVIESNSKYSIILTTAKLCKCSMDDTKIMVHLADGRSYKGKIKAYDFYFDIAAIRIRPNISLPVASLALVNDSISVDPSCLHFMEEESSQLSPQSTTSCDLIPGEVVIALGRFPRRPYPIMAAPGLFSAVSEGLSLIRRET